MKFNIVWEQDNSRAFFMIPKGDESWESCDVQHNITVEFIFPLLLTSLLCLFCFYSLLWDFFSCLYAKRKQKSLWMSFLGLLLITSKKIFVRILMVLIMSLGSN